MGIGHNYLILSPTARGKISVRNIYVHYPRTFSSVPATEILYNNESFYDKNIWHCGLFEEIISDHQFLSAFFHNLRQLFSELACIKESIHSIFIQIIGNGKRSTTQPLWCVLLLPVWPSSSKTNLQQINWFV